MKAGIPTKEEYFEALRTNSDVKYYVALRDRAAQFMVGLLANPESSAMNIDEISKAAIKAAIAFEYAWSVQD